MIKSAELIIHTSEFAFFVANCDKHDVLAQANIHKIQNKNYNFGIILNNIVIDPMFDNLKIPLYAPIANELFLLDVMSKPKNIHDDMKKYRFIFVDVDSVYRDNYDGSFYEQLIMVLIDSYLVDQIFVVSNTTPFHYLKWEPFNIIMRHFVKILETYIGHNIIYLSTDCDYFNDLVMYHTTDAANAVFSDKRMNLVMAGQIGDVNRPPMVFGQDVYLVFCDEYAYYSKKMEKLSGHVKYITNSKLSIIQYENLNMDDIVKYIVHNLFKIIQHSESVPLSIEQTESLICYKKFIEENNCVGLYKQSVASDKDGYRKKALINNMLDNLVPTINRLLLDGLINVCI